MNRVATNVVDRGTRRASRVAASKASKRSATKDFLINVGEELLGRHGFDGISLREIARKAGQANNAAVHYHFRDKEGLIKAILEDRVAKIEALRRDSIGRLSSGERKDPRELMKILWLPSMAITSPDGSHTYCRFLLQYMLHPGTALHPAAPVAVGAGRLKVESENAVSSLLATVELLLAQCKHLSATIFYRRLSVLSMMFLSAVVEHDNIRRADRNRAAAAFDADRILDMAMAALSAPD